MSTVGDSTHQDARTRWWSGVMLPVGLVALMWLVQLVDEVALGDRLEQHGIRPRRVDGLFGIIWSPFLHAGFGHLIANTLPFLVLGGLVMAYGRTRWIVVTVGVALLGGGLTWLFGRSASHIGASGVVFGYFGYLMGSAFFRRNLISILTAVVAVVLYGGLIFGIAPRAGVSWEGHVFGLLAGLVIARSAGVASSPTR